MHVDGKGEDESAWTARWFSKDERYLWSLGLDAWNTRNGTRLGTGKMKKHARKGRNFPIALDISADGRRIITGSWPSGCVTVWNVETQRAVYTRCFRKGLPWAVQFIGDVNRFAVWYREPPTLITSGVADDAAERVVALKDVGGPGIFSPGGRFFAMDVVDKGVHIWSVEEGTRIRVLRSGKTFVIAFDPKTRWVATGGDDNKVRVWDILTGTERLVLEGHGKGAVFLPCGVYSLAADAEGNRIASGGHDGHARIWDATTGNLLTEAVIATEPTACGLRRPTCCPSVPVLPGLPGRQQ